MIIHYITIYLARYVFEQEVIKLEDYAKNNEF